MKKDIIEGNIFLGIELGSTRIKSVLINDKNEVIEKGIYEWENQIIDGYYTYLKDDIIKGLQSSYLDLKRRVLEKYNIKITKIKAMGISAMMHGYIALDKDDNFLVNFRTWRNTNTVEASDILSNKFDYHIPQRWTISHLYQAILNKEEHVNKINKVFTLASYIHYLLTENFVIGIGDASGIFPIDYKTKQYNERMVNEFENLINHQLDLLNIIPKPLLAGEEGGILTLKGAHLLDIEHDLLPGSILCPPEGDAGTGMVFTNSITKGTGNVSAGTSVFMMMVLNNSLKHHYDEIDIVSTPDGEEVAMIHCNNCSSDINEWMNLFSSLLEKLHVKVDKNELYYNIFASSLDADDECGNILTYNFLSNEPICNVYDGKPMLIRQTKNNFNISNLAKSLLYSAFINLRIGIDILKDENIDLKIVKAQGGIFKTPHIAQDVLSTILNVPTMVDNNSSEGGAYGIALLSKYLFSAKKKTLEKYLNQIFNCNNEDISYPNKENYDHFNKYYQQYLERLSLKKEKSKYYELKKRVYEANLELVKNNLVILTWGNVSEYDKENQVVAIKPSGVNYNEMKIDDIVITDLNGNIVEGNLKPSSDLLTHLEIYKHFDEVKSVVHTHSTYATICAQNGENVNCYGTTHADYFYKDICCSRKLTEEEVKENYELNTGKVIVETINDNKENIMSSPAILVNGHGPFVFGKSVKNAIDNSLILEQVCKMYIFNKLLKNNLNGIDQYIIDKHYYRKHGKNAYYGQNKQGE